MTPPKPQEQKEPFKVTLFAMCVNCDEHADSEAPCKKLADLRITPDGEPYCENCWFDSPYNTDGAWDTAETLEHRLNSAPPPAMESEREDEEWARIMALSDEEVIAETIAAGEDPDEVVRRSRASLATAIITSRALKASADAHAKSQSNSEFQRSLMRDAFTAGAEWQRAYARSARTTDVGTHYSRTGAEAGPDPLITMQTGIAAHSAPAALSEEDAKGLACVEVVEHDSGKEVWLLLRSDVPGNIGAGSVRLNGAFAGAFSRAIKKRDAIISRLTGQRQ